MRQLRGSAIALDSLQVHRSAPGDRPLVSPVVDAETFTGVALRLRDDAIVCQRLRHLLHALGGVHIHLLSHEAVVAALARAIRAGAVTLEASELRWGWSERALTRLTSEAAAPNGDDLEPEESVLTRARGEAAPSPPSPAPGTERSPEAVAWAQAAEAPLAPELAWAQELRDAAPKPDPGVAAGELAAYVKRQREIETAYAKVMSGETTHPAVSAERLRQAKEGDVDRTRIPLTFKDRAQYEQFRQELTEALARAGVDDAVVQQVGSATTGFKGNPTKPFGTWQPPGSAKPSDSDFAVFSQKALAQAMENGAPVNTKIVQNGQYTVFKNEVAGTEQGFYRTPVGKELAKLAARWNEEIYGSNEVDGFDFKLNTTTEPFRNAVTVIGG